MVEKLVSAFGALDDSDLRGRIERLIFEGRQQSISEEAMRTQIYAVSYFLRQTSRDFDSAFLLEELTEELLSPQRETCLLAPGAPNHYADIELASL